MDLSSRPPLAGILVRFAAVLLDGIVPLVMAIPAATVLWIISLSFPAMPGDMMQIVAIFVVLLTYMGILSYSALVLALWAYGLTPGKWMLGLRVVSFDTGRAASFWRMALRQVIGQLISAILCYLGFLWALFDPNKQGWHDKIAKTLVIRTR